MFFSNLDDEIIYGNGNVSLNSTLSIQNQHFNIKKSPTKFSPLKLQKPIKKVIIYIFLNFVLDVGKIQNLANTHNKYSFWSIIKGTTRYC